VHVESYTTKAGERTQLRRQRLVSPLELLFRAGQIGASQFGAARRYQRDADMAATIGPGAAVNYSPRMVQSSGGSPLLPIEAATFYLARMARAQLSCGAELRPVLDWIASEPCPWHAQARAWWPEASERTLRAEFHRRLRATCDRLRRHYMATA
jgi:hypothetical protein